MSALASECSSGCESGWTLYLEHSFINQNASSSSHTRFIGVSGYEQHRDKRPKDEDSDEEDLSMLSDASSWPPHDEVFFNEQENRCFYSASKEVKNLASSATITKRQKQVKEIQHCEDQHLPSFLHDTASSHVFDFSTIFQNQVDANNQQTSTESMLDYSQGFSATYIGRRPPFQDHFGFLQPSLSENGLHGSKWYGGKGIGMR